MAIKFFDRAKMDTLTVGAGTITLGSAVSPFQSFAAAGVANADVVSYLIEDGLAWEVGIGTYTSSGTTLSRTLVSSSTGSLIVLSGSAVVSVDFQAKDASSAATIHPPCGRLTLTTAVPVLTSDVTAATTVYYTPYHGNSAPIYDATTGQIVNRAFAELSQATTDATKSPAAVGTYKNYDVFLWDDAGTQRATRGPAWTRAQSFTVTLASPAVFTATGHGLREGFPVVLTTTGALPTGLTAGTTYFVIAAGLTADAFEVAATAGGAAINTSGSQSGVHTCTDSNIVRGTGAGTTQLTLTNGYYVNTVAITNGPGAGLGIYLGTIRSNGSSQIDMIFGGTGVAGGESTFLGVWNNYNRVQTALKNLDNTDTWTYTTATVRAKNAAASGVGYNNRIQVVVGLSEDELSATNSAMLSNSSSTIQCLSMIGLNNTVGLLQGFGKASIARASSIAGQQTTLVSHIRLTAPLGYTQLFPLEESGASGTATWYGDNGETSATTNNGANSFFSGTVMA